MKGNFRKMLRKFCLEGTVAGLKYFYLFTDKTSRCFWGIFLIVIMYFACLLTYLLYRRFDAMPTRITIENQFEPIAQLPYPSITICSPNQITEDAVEHLDQTLVNGNTNRSLDLKELIPQLLGFYHFVHISPDALEHLQRLIEMNRYSISEVLVLLAQKCEDFMQVCLLKNRVYPRCRGLFRPLLTKHGLCCNFNGMYEYKANGRNERKVNFKPHLVNIHGLGGGLTVITDYNPQKAIDHSIHFSGANRVMFTDWTEFPSDDEMLLVAPNSESYHFIHALATYCSSDVKELPSGSRKCIFEDEIHLPFFGRYRNSDCDMLCLVQIVEKTCGCLLAYLPQLKVKQACGFDRILCVIAAKLNLNQWLEDEQCVCPRDCDARRYQVDVSVGNLHALHNQLVQVSSNSNHNKSLSIMRFIFPRPIYVKQKQETVMSLTTLASNLGGVFGLCLGCSVISVLEICFYYNKTARNYFSRRLQRRLARKRGFYYE